MQLRVSRGKSYEGENFSLSWKITLQVPLNPSSSNKGGSKGFDRLLRKRDKAAAAPTAAVTKKTILDGLMGHAEKGQLVAVMGSSGCGKTSFLDCISMRNQSFSGNIFV
jgi:ABC-type multidrug transport system ATPase subunit